MESLEAFQDMIGVAPIMNESDGGGFISVLASIFGGSRTETVSPRGIEGLLRENRRVRVEKRSRKQRLPKIVEEDGDRASVCGILFQCSKFVCRFKLHRFNCYRSCLTQ